MAEHKTKIHLRTERGFDRPAPLREDPLAEQDMAEVISLHDCTSGAKAGPRPTQARIGSSMLECASRR